MLLISTPQLITTLQWLVLSLELPQMHSSLHILHVLYLSYNITRLMFHPNVVISLHWANCEGNTDDKATTQKIVKVGADKGLMSN